MTRKARLPQRPRHIHVFDEDWDFLFEHFGPHSTSRFGVANAIREMVHTQVRRFKAKEIQLADVEKEAQGI